MTETLYTAPSDGVRAKLADALVEDAETGRYQVRRSVFTDEDLFELEMKHIFEGNWIYLAHESQIPNVDDYFTTYMGRQPIVISRNKDGELNALVNACSHRGAMLCRRKTATGPRSPARSTAGRSTTPASCSRSRTRVRPATRNSSTRKAPTTSPRSRGSRTTAVSCSAASMPTSLPLEEHLGDTTKIIDMIVDQSPDGLEVLRGASTYTYDGNWKLHAENGADGYHVSATVHWNYAATTTSAEVRASPPTPRRRWTPASWAKQSGGFYSFDNGHLLLWTKLGRPRGPSALRAS